MEHGGEADAGAEMARIGRDGQHRLGGGAQEQIIDHRLVLPGDVGHPGRQREHDVEIAHRQQVGLARGEPVPCRGALTLGAVPIATGIVGDADLAAILTGLDMAAEGCGAAGLDRRHHLELAETEMAGLGRTPGGAMTMEDIGDLQRRTAHRHRVTRPAAPRPAAQARSGRAGS